MTSRSRPTRAHRIWLAVVLASRLPCGQPTTHIASTTGSTAGSIIEAHLSDDDAGNNNGGSRSGPVSLVEKYTFRETVRTVIDEDSLPELPDFLESINLGDRLEDFYGKNVFETRYLFELNDMDLRLMGLSPEEISTVKESAAEIRVEREVTVERLDPLLQKRNGLSYGRLFLERSASSFEFYLAGFGPPAPLDEARLVWAEPRDACGSLSNPDLLSGAIVLAERGTCSFVDKANTVAGSNALALVVINSGADGEDLFRVAATLGGRSGGEEEPKGPDKMPTVLVRGSTLSALSKALEWGAEGGDPVTARLVPLDCKPGKASCEAVLPEEQKAEKQVDSGNIYISAPRPTPAADVTVKERGVANTSEAFEFLSATFGATLPRGHVSLAPSSPEDACSPLAPLAAVAAAEGRDSSGGSGDGRGGGIGGGASDEPPPSTAVLVKRGGCSFGVKAKNVQDAGGRVIIFQDNGLGVLQNVGAPDPLAKDLYMPGVFVTARAGDALAAAATAAANSPPLDDGCTATSGLEEEGRCRPGGLKIRFTPDNAVGRAWGALGATPWPDDLLELRVLARQLRATHAASPCRWNWIEEKVRQAEGPGLAASAKAPSRAEAAVNQNTATGAAATATATGTAETTDEAGQLGAASKADQSDHAQHGPHVNAEHTKGNGSENPGGAGERGRKGGKGGRGAEGRGGRGSRGGGMRRAKGGRPGILKEL